MYPLNITFTETYVPSSYDILLRRMFPLHITFYWDVCALFICHFTETYVSLFIWHFTETYVSSSYDILLRSMYPLHMTFYWDVCTLFIWHSLRRMYPLNITFTETYVWHFTETYVPSSYNILLRHMCPLHMSFYWDVCIPLHMTFYWDVCALFI